jgi:hypothetical protein
MKPVVIAELHSENSFGFRPSSFAPIGTLFFDTLLHAITPFYTIISKGVGVSRSRFSISQFCLTPVAIQSSLRSLSYLMFKPATWRFPVRKTAPLFAKIRQNSPKFTKIHKNSQKFTKIHKKTQGGGGEPLFFRVAYLPGYRRDLIRVHTRPFAVRTSPSSVHSVTSCSNQPIVGGGLPNFQPGAS